MVFIYYLNLFIMVFNSLNNEYFFKITFIKLLGSCIDFLQTPGRLLLYFKDY